ncbi:hypothetical protein B0H17DRAFT_1262872 [Mycena rosella]|uniref:Uncharacterized protein n=1 Tax=Mycena rosella TaxID=1033263 RepID=A0AAD7CQ16_MYCRO|nr:hypothetical protein B0H17DRAFT_1262872 [Mycena rosella]
MSVVRGNPRYNCRNWVIVINSVVVNVNRAEDGYLLELGSFIDNRRHGVLAAKDARAINFAGSDDDLSLYESGSAPLDHIGGQRLFFSHLREEIEVPQPNGAEICSGWSALRSLEDLKRNASDGGGRGLSQTLNVPPAMVNLLQWSSIALDVEGKVRGKAKEPLGKGSGPRDSFRTDPERRRWLAKEIKRRVLNDAVACGFV